MNRFIKLLSLLSFSVAFVIPASGGSVLVSEKNDPVYQAMTHEARALLEKGYSLKQIENHFNDVLEKTVNEQKIIEPSPTISFKKLFLISGAVLVGVTACGLFYVMSRPEERPDRHIVPFDPMTTSPAKKYVISLVRGEMADQKFEDDKRAAVVIETNEQCGRTASGAFGKICAKAGPDLDLYVNKYLQSSMFDNEDRRLEDGDVAVLPGYKFGKNVMLAATDFNRYWNSKFKSYGERYKEILDAAEEFGMSAVALPVLGFGKTIKSATRKDVWNDNHHCYFTDFTERDLSANELTQNAVAAIKNYLKHNNESTSLKEIRLVLPDATHDRLYQVELEKALLKKVKISKAKKRVESSLAGTVPGQMTLTPNEVKRLP